MEATSWHEGSLPPNQKVILKPPAEADSLHIPKIPSANQRCCSIHVAKKWQIGNDSDGYGIWQISWGPWYFKPRCPIHSPLKHRKRHSGCLTIFVALSIQHPTNQSSPFSSLKRHFGLPLCACTFWLSTPSRFCHLTFMDPTPLFFFLVGYLFSFSLHLGRWLVSDTSLLIDIFTKGSFRYGLQYNM